MESRGDRFDFVFVFGCLDKQNVRPSFTVELRALQSTVEPFDGASVRSRNDCEFRRIARVDCSEDFLRHFGSRDELFALQMAALLWSYLILNVDRGDACALIILYGRNSHVDDRKTRGFNQARAQTIVGAWGLNHIR